MRLEGTTHYTLAIYPELYWVAYGEVLLLVGERVNSRESERAG